MILNEGGNVFKTPDGQAATQSINQADVEPTLKWLEKITGLDHVNFMLGSTGIKPTSGDQDVAVDKEKVNKDALVGKLKAWKDSNAPKDDDRSWIAKSGVSVHFKTPIKGDANNGFVQTDLMFGDPKFMKFALRGAADSEFKGQHRMIMIASIAKAQGYKWSPTNGLVDRITNEPVTKDPNEVAKVLLGDGASADDMRSVETINAKIKTDPNYENLVKDAKDYFDKEGLKLP